MGDLLRFRRKHPLGAAVIAAALIVVAGVGLVWSLGTNEPLLPSVLYGLGRITHINVWHGSVTPSATVQNLALLTVVVAAAGSIYLGRLFLDEWGKHVEIQVTFHAPCGESFQGTTYQLFGLMRLLNVGKEDFLMVGWSIETEWGVLHASEDAERYQLLKSQLREHFRTAYLGYESINLLKAGALRGLLVPVLQEQDMGRAAAVSPSRKLLILEGQKERLTFRIEYEGEMTAIPMERGY